MSWCASWSDSETCDGTRASWAIRTFSGSSWRTSATHLNESQRTAIALQRSWSRLRPEDCDGDVEAWWERLLRSPRESLTNHQRAVVDAYRGRQDGVGTRAEKALRPWIVRHNKGTYWVGTDIIRRQRLDGAAVAGHDASSGLPIPPQQLLPFFLAARSAVRPGQDLLGEALCSSYEAFRFTRQNARPAKDEQDESPADDAWICRMPAGT